MKPKGKASPEPFLLDLFRFFREYRAAVDRIFSTPSPAPRVWRRIFHKILSASIRLYLAYLTLEAGKSKLFRASRKCGLVALVARDSDASFRRETNLRARMRDRLESAFPWGCFLTENAFSRNTGLWERRDFIERFSLHLPEIYEETIMTEGHTRAFLSSGSQQALSDLMVGMEHLAINHVSFVLQALQWVAGESDWMEPAMAARRQQEASKALDKVGIGDRTGSLAARLARSRGRRP